MLHVTCDHCGKELRPHEDQHYVVKIETFAVDESEGLTEEDLEQDHLEEISEILNQGDEEFELEEPRKAFRYDMCQDCHRRFLRDPLGKEAPHKMYFSKN